MQKDEIANYITNKIGVSPVNFSRGSTEPKELFIQIAIAIGLEFSNDMSKPELAKLIVERSGNKWHSNFESNGATVTKEGLEAVKNAVDFFLN